MALGIFDGVHVGHQALLRAVLHWARREGLTAMALTFSPHPAKVLSPAYAPLLLEPMAARLHNMGALGMDALLVQPFDHAFASTSAEAFVRDVLHGRLAARHVVVGQHFVFGSRQQGTVALLEALGAELGFAVHPVEPVRVQGMVASSSKIREFVQRGELAGAQALLGRPYRLWGAWGQPGASAGQSWLGWTPAGEQLPPGGSYAGWAVAPDAATPVLLRVVRPTGNDGEAAVTVLVHGLELADGPGGEVAAAALHGAQYVALAGRLPAEANPLSSAPPTPLALAAGAALVLARPEH